MVRITTIGACVAVALVAAGSVNAVRAQIVCCTSVCQGGGSTEVCSPSACDRPSCVTACSLVGGMCVDFTSSGCPDGRDALSCNILCQPVCPPTFTPTPTSTPTVTATATVTQTATVTHTPTRLRP